MGQFGYMDDCVHLKACRRLVKRAKSMGFSMGRGCNKDCTAYEDVYDFAAERGLYTPAEVEKVKDGACEDGHRGYYPGDILVSDYV